MRLNDSAKDVALRYHFHEFTRENYRNLLKVAKQSFTFRTYENFQPNESFILWRHDIDYSVHSAYKMAQIEAEEDLTCLYTLNIHSEFYNVFEKDTTRLVRDIIELGHCIGVHIDSSYYEFASIDALEVALAFERDILERVFGQEINVFSFHNPSQFDLTCDKWSYEGLINCYSAYFKQEVDYCSDSNGYWRYRKLEDVLGNPESRQLQVLTHPVWWQDEPMAPRQRILRCIEGRAEKTKRHYDEMFAESGRLNIDENGPR